jgi:3,4-dihydroxy-2-butanone 4-phosphate synthase
MSRQGTLRFAEVPEALEQIRAGRPVIVVKNEQRPAADGLPEYVVAAAALATPEVVNEMTSLGGACSSSA